MVLLWFYFSGLLNRQIIRKMILSLETGASLCYSQPLFFPPANRESPDEPAVFSGISVFTASIPILSSINVIVSEQTAD